MKDFKAHTVDTPSIIATVRRLFEGYLDLILGINIFLPKEYEITTLNEPQAKKPAALWNKKSLCNKMKVQRLSSDMISTLPKDIIENILTCMPIRDALRTSILSRRWRYCWMSMPKVTFDEKLFEVSSNDAQMKKYKLVNAIFHVLLLHKGPILEFSLHVGKLNMVCEFDQIILHLSRSNHVKKLIFEILTNHCKLPSLFFTLQGLEFLDITNCVFEPPLTFKGFNRLSTVYFVNVEISAKTLLRFLSNCPLLEIVALVGYEKDFEGGSEFTFVQLLECLPLITTFEVSEYYMKYFSAGGMPRKLPTSLVRLTQLYLDVCFMEQCVVSSALCLIRSSPNLKDIVFTLILAKSPVLKKLTIKLSCKVSVDEEVTMLRDLIHVPLPRASPSAKFIVERP